MPKKIPPKPVALSVREAASFLSVSRSRIYELINAGELVAYKDGARTLISTASCEEWLEGLKPFPTSPPPTGPLLEPKDRKLARRRVREPAIDSTAPLLPAEQQRLATEKATEPEPPLPIDPQQCGESSAPDAQQRSSVEPASDLAAIYFERRRLLSAANDPNEAEARAFEYIVNAYRRDYRGTSLEEAKAVMKDAIARAKEKV